MLIQQYRKASPEASKTIRTRNAGLIVYILY